uniref:Coiled-coil serine-rich protein 2a n=1 Tax=Nothobranchius furzeri TaxID=105023 RepID=A0A8C6LU07_NOTFU
MEEKTSTGPAMVSRLPKFGGRPSTNGFSPLCNGSTQPTASAQDGKTTTSGARQNGMTRTSPLSLKCKRDDGVISSYSTTPIVGDKSEDTSQAQILSSVKEAKKSSPATPVMRRSGCLAMAVSSPKSIPKQSLKMIPKGGAKLGQSPLNRVAKMTNSGSSIPPRAGSESRLVRPVLGTTSARSASQDSLSQYNESPKTSTLDNIVRSNSFTHFKQIPSPTSEPMIRSFSFNRAVELAKPLANTQLRPPRSSFLKPPQVSNGRVGLVINGSLGGGIGGLQYNKSPPFASCLPTSSVTPSTPRTLKKPLLPNSVGTKSLSSSVGSLGSRLARLGQTNQQRCIVPDQVKEHINSLVLPESNGLLGVAKGTDPIEEAGKRDSPSDNDGNGNGIANGGGMHWQSTSQGAGETLEDMSLSSASSLDRFDTSEEFLDDTDSVEDACGEGDMPDNRKASSTTLSSLHSFHSETIDWESKEMTKYKEESPVQESQESLALSPEQGDAPPASSVELSPSSSSGGTYMWDEEGLEPLRRRETPLDSYDDSELNSMDILNNLDSPGAADLDDSDLMLDAGLPDDSLQDFDRMSCIERPKQASRQGQRHKQHRWSGPDHLYSDGRAQVFQNYDGFRGPRMSSRYNHSEGRQWGYRPTLDKLTLEHMTQDCSFLKNQLLRLKSLLELEETDSPADVSEQAEDITTVSQMEVLIKEVQVLREELRSRDKTIAQLTLQCQQLQQHQREHMSYQGRQVKCQCHHQRAPASLRPSDRPTDKWMQHHDKATQTYWRPPSHPGALPTPFLSPWQSQHQGFPSRTNMPQRRQRVEQLVQYFTDRACLQYYSLSTPISASTPTRKN